MPLSKGFNFLERRCWSIKTSLCSKDKGGNKFIKWLPVVFAIITGYLLWMQSMVQSDSEKNMILAVIIMSGIYFAYINVRINDISTNSFKESFDKVVLTERKKRDFFLRKASSQLKQISRMILKKATKFVKSIATIIIILLLLVVIVNCIILVGILLLILNIIND